MASDDLSRRELEGIAAILETAGIEVRVQESEQAVLAYYARNHGGDTSVSLRLVQDDCCACTYEVLKEGRAVSRIMYMEGKFQEMR